LRLSPFSSIFKVFAFSLRTDLEKPIILQSKSAGFARKIVVRVARGQESGVRILDSNFRNLSFLRGWGRDFRPSGIAGIGVCGILAEGGKWIFRRG
jgi:hypothetical protein